ncbi:putative RNA cytidine acetyltransferase 1 [Cocos nucifera]|uniref:RNA cytidine acetyltransferase n=1 Tax=Cocos nucifera TaxID=13894 RepID=A0A8K0I9W2_COCNU|nr:putative RNA cytidine acetyltransferase 1 [Cocos nucifera]
MRKKVDDRIRTLIENGVKLRHRSMFVIVGDKSRDQIVNLHYMLSKAVVKSRPTVLWCYKEKLELSSHRKKRAKQIKKLMQRGLLDPEKVDPFTLFIESGNITYCLYKDSERILGNTFGMCILQDFEALTPNLLARTIETVEGGGLIILLLRSLSSLTSLYTMVMDAEGLSERERELKTLKEQFHDDFPVGPLIGKCCTMDQGKAVITFLDAILDKALRSTVALIAARGRGKSAALGLAVAGAVAAGYSNIFVTAPSPENLKTLFEFVCKGINALEYKEHLHYDVVKSADPDLKKATVQINVYKQHRQTIQYLKPHDHGKLSQVELLVIDEAAAIPLPVVKSLLGPYLVFLSSTVNGYEGTGRSLSLKLLQQLESQSQMPAQKVGGSHSGRFFKKIKLNESIRYASGDPIESWLNGLLCLDVASYIPNITRLPHPSKCDLYYVNRDTLFSYHKESEIFLQRMMALYVASHYKNSPNDLQLMADAPSHHLFVLLGPVDESKNQLPDILCVIQVCLEGQISRKSAIKSLSEGHQPFGDQIPWKFCEQFQDDVFPTLSGARIVRIAVHPSALRLGYGSTAVELLTRYYEGQLTAFAEIDAEEIEEPTVKVTEAAEKASLLEENIKPRANLPPLLVHLHERRPEKLHYLGVSFGLTRDLFRFWRKHNFYPFYIGHIPSAVTGEHTCMILKSLNNDEIEVGESGQSGFLAPFYRDFRQRFMRLLGSTFHALDYKLAMSILASKINFPEQEPTTNGTLKPMGDLLSPYDMKRLEAYTNNRVDYHMASLLEENIKPRANLPPLLVHLHERRPEKLHYLGVSFGLTRDLFRFWRKHNFYPFYIGHIPSAVTGEHTCMILKSLNNDEIEVGESGQSGFLAPFYRDFRQRFMRLLGSTFHALDYKLAMSILASKINFPEQEPTTNGTLKPMGDLLSPYDMKRLEAYTNNRVDYHMILDLVPILAHQFFQEKLPVTLSPVQASVLFCMGLQNHDITYIKEEMKLEREQILSLFIKVMKKLYEHLYGISAKEIDATLPRLKEVQMAPHSISVDEDLNEAAGEVIEKMKAGNEGILDPEHLQQYAIADREGDFEKALQNGRGKLSASGLLSVKSNKVKMEKQGKYNEMSKGKRKGKDGDRLRSNKKKKS